MTTTTRERIRSAVIAAQRPDGPRPAVLQDLTTRANEGSPEITEWCPTCLERTIPLRNGTCGFCDTALGEIRDTELEPPSTIHGSKIVAPEPNSGALPESGDESSAPAPRIPRRRDRAHKRGRPYSDEQIIARIKLWAEITGLPPSKADWNVSRLKQLEATAVATVDRHLRRIALYRLGDFPSETTVRARFGSLNAALVLAGFEPRANGRPPKSGNRPGVPRPEVGRAALGECYGVVQGVLDGDQIALKGALYQLGLSAILWADKIDGGSE